MSAPPETWNKSKETKKKNKKKTPPLTPATSKTHVGVYFSVWEQFTLPSFTAPADSESRLQPIDGFEHINPVRQFIGEGSACPYKAFNEGSAHAHLPCPLQCRGGGGGGGVHWTYSRSAYSLFSPRALLAGSVCPARPIQLFPVNLQFLWVSWAYRTVLLITH